MTSHASQIHDSIDPGAAIDLSQAQKFLTALDPNAHEFWFQTFDDKKDRRESSLSRSFRGTLELHAETLIELNLKGAAVAVGINDTGERARRNEFVGRCRAVWCDYDRKQKESHSLTDLLSLFPLEPSFIVNTSEQNYHFYWFADALGRGLFGPIMSRLVEDYFGDPSATDLARVLRLPGFLHQKNFAQLTNIVASSGRRYHREELLEAFPPLPHIYNQYQASENPVEFSTLELDRIRSALEFVSPVSRNLWFAVGGAIFDLTSGSDTGFEIWDSWSAAAPDKYDYESQLSYWRHEFTSDRSQRAGIGSIYFHASKNGWLGFSQASANVLADVYEANKPGKLAGLTMESLREKFGTIGHRPSESQMAALTDLASTLEAMADGVLPPNYYLCCLAPGMGKTQTIIHFVKHLLASPEYVGVGAVIFVGRLAEIKTLVNEMGLSREEFSVLVNSSAENEDLNTIGIRDTNSSRVLFTTQQMLQQRSRGKCYGELSDFFYNGEPRRVRIWDEAILPARPLSVNVSLVEAMTHVVAKTNPKLHANIVQLIKNIRDRKNREFLEIPNFEDSCDVDLNGATGIFVDEKKAIRNAVNELWLLAGTNAAVRRERGGNTVLDYKPKLPEDLKPIVITDASGTVRKTYPHWTKGRGDLVFLRHADKDYAKLHVHVWKRGGGKQAWLDNFEELIEGILGTLNGPMIGDCLIVHHKYNKITFPIDVPTLSRAETNRKLHFVHWGDHSATNAYRDVSNVILAGTLFYESSYYEALGRLSQKLPPGEPLAEEDYDEIVSGEHAHLILQALCRGSVRKCEGVHCVPCNAYIIAVPRSGIPAMLREGVIFPGCQVSEWLPVKREPNGRVERALGYLRATLVEGDRTIVSVPEVRDHLNIKDRGTFLTEVVRHKDFRLGLEELRVDVVARPGRAGSYFRRKLLGPDGIERPWEDE